MILQPDRKYTLSEIFELNVDIATLLNELGYTYHRQKLDLVQHQIPFAVSQNLQDEFYRHLPRIALHTDRARREFIVSTVLSELLDHAPFSIKCEYGVRNHRLRGELDYLLEADRPVVVSFAKNDEMERGFRQLAVELIAASDYLELDRLYGVVTTGSIWNFGFLDRKEHTITRDIDSFAVPNGLADLMNTLAGLIVQN